MIAKAGSAQPMATVHTFGPFRLDATAEILFREAEPVAPGLPHPDRGSGGKRRAGRTFGHGADMDCTPARDQSRLSRFRFQEPAAASRGRPRTLRGRPAQSGTAGVEEIHK